MLLWIPNNNNALVLRSAQPSPPHPRFASALTLRAPARAPSRLAAMAEPKRAKLGSKASPSAPAVATAALAPSSSSLTESVVPPSSRPAPACVSHEVVDSFAVPGPSQFPFFSLKKERKKERREKRKKREGRGKRKRSTF